MSIQMSPKKEKLLNELEEEINSLFGGVSEQYDKEKYTGGLNSRNV